MALGMTNFLSAVRFEAANSNGRHNAVIDGRATARRLVQQLVNPDIRAELDRGLAAGSSARAIASNFARGALCIK